MHAPICRQSPKLGSASNNGLGAGSLPARHNENLADISCPCTWIPNFLYIAIVRSIRTRSALSWLTPASTTLSQIKYGEQRNKKTSGERVSSGCQLNLVRLKKFVQVSERTGFCVDTENAAVWAFTRVQHFSVSLLAKFCTSWYFRIFELNHVQLITHGGSHHTEVPFNFLATGNPLSI